MMNLILTNMQLVASQDGNWWTGVMWITCGLLLFFYQLFGLSFWWHPFTEEDIFVSKWCNAKFLQICSDEETSSSTSWMPEGEYIFIKFSFLGELFLTCFYVKHKLLYIHYENHSAQVWENTWRYDKHQQKLSKPKLSVLLASVMSKRYVQFA